MLTLAHGLHAPTARLVTRPNKERSRRRHGIWGRRAGFRRGDLRNGLAELVQEAVPLAAQLRVRTSLSLEHRVQRDHQLISSFVTRCRITFSAISACWRINARNWTPEITRR